MDEKKESPKERAKRIRIRIESPEMPKIENLLRMAPECKPVLIGAICRKRLTSETGEEQLLRELEEDYEQKKEPISKSKMKKLGTKSVDGTDKRSGKTVSKYVNRLLSDGSVESKGRGYIPKFRTDIIHHEVRQILNYILYLQTYTPISPESMKYIETICELAEIEAIKIPPQIQKTEIDLILEEAKKEIGAALKAVSEGKEYLPPGSSVVILK